MTALAGAVGPFDGNAPEIVCRAALSAQTAYGRLPPSFASIDGATFGISLHALLPEDAFDSQPVRERHALCVADLRLDNRADLLRRLGERVEAFAKRADADILFAALNRWGEAALDHIVGDFAFAWFDGRQGKLLLARDPLGNRPLFYRRTGASVRFASMPSGLADARLTVDLDVMAARMSGLRAGGGRTIFETVRSVEPGEVVTIAGSRETVRRYWHPARRIESRPTEELIGAYRAHLDDAVASRLRSNAPLVAAQLSSGYDSNAVTSTAARLIPAEKSLLAFTSAPAIGLATHVPPHRVADESAAAASAAAAYAIRHEVVRDPTPLLSALGAATRLQQQPFRNHLNMGWWTATMDAAAANGASAILIATLGNFTLSYGGPTLLPYLVSSGHFGQWWREARGAVGNNSNRWRGILMESFHPWLPRGATGLLKRMFVGAPPPSRFDFLRPNWAQLLKDWPGGALLPPFSGDHFADQVAWIQVDDFGMLNKGLLAQTGVDVRDAAGDRRLVEFCLSLPLDQLLRDGDYKPLARKALADRVPRAILDARRRGFQGADWNARFSPAAANALIDEIAASSQACQLLDVARLRDAVAHWPDPDSSSFQTMFGFGRSIANALAAGYFVAQVEREPLSFGR